MLLNKLKAARKLLSNEENFCTGSYAKTEDGVSIPPESTLATKFCALGAIIRCEIPYFSVKLNQKASKMFGTNIAEVNDRLGREKVLEVFDACIKDLESCQPCTKTTTQHTFSS